MKKLNQKDTAQYADIFAALGSESRLEIMRLMFATYPEGMTVGEIQEKLKIPNSTLSHHLEKLRNEGLVNCQKDKQFLWYSANAETMEDLLSFLTTGKTKSDRLPESVDNTFTQEGFMIENFFASIFERLFGLISERFHLKGFERFTAKAIAVISTAQSESRRLSHQYVGTEQILLGLVSEGSNAAEILNSMGVNLENAQIEVEKIIGRGNKLTPVDIPFTPRAKEVLELSVAESQKLGHNYIGTEHLLLGILREGARSIGQGVAIKVLQNLRVDLVSLEEQLQAALS